MESEGSPVDGEGTKNKRARLPSHKALLNVCRSIFLLQSLVSLHHILALQQFYFVSFVGYE